MTHHFTVTEGSETLSQEAATETLDKFNKFKQDALNALAEHPHGEDITKAALNAWIEKKLISQELADKFTKSFGNHKNNKKRKIESQPANLKSENKINSSAQDPKKTNNNASRVASESAYVQRKY